MTGLEEMGDMEELLEEILAQYDLEVEKIGPYPGRVAFVYRCRAVHAAGSAAKSGRI